MRNLVPALGLSLLFSAGCTLNTDYFSEYRGKNLLSNHDFGVAGVWQTSTYGLVTAGVDDYMLWEGIATAAHPADISAATPTLGPDGVSPAYRLEIKNLVPDGDFEAEAEGSTTTAANWSKNRDVVAGGTAVVYYSLNHTTNQAPAPLSFIAGARTIDHRSMLVSSTFSGDQVALELDTALGSLWLPGQYRIRFDLLNGTAAPAFGVRFYDGGGGGLTSTDAQDSGLWDQTGLSVIGPSANTQVVRTGSQTFTVAAATDTRKVVFGTNAPANDAALIDNVHVVLANQDLDVLMSLPSLSSGALKLLPGTKSGAYTFTLEVRDDPTADQNQTFHVANRSNPQGITIWVEGKAKNTSSLQALAKVFFTRPASGWTSWTKLTVNGGLDFVDLDSDLDGQPALRVKLSPTNEITSGKDSGSLLVAQPNLSYNP